jgi:hypothetical protein
MEQSTYARASADESSLTYWKKTQLKKSEESLDTIRIY